MDVLSWKAGGGGALGGSEPQMGGREDTAGDGMSQSRTGSYTIVS